MVRRQDVVMGNGRTSRAGPAAQSIKQGACSVTPKGRQSRLTLGLESTAQGTMHLSSYLALLSICSAGWAAPVDQTPLAAKGAPRVFRSKSPYTPEHRDPYDRKVDSIGNKLNPLPWVS